MSSNVYTLPELVDLALQTPQVGAVNFNLLRIILHKILTECQLQNITGTWEPMLSEQSDFEEKSSWREAHRIPGRKESATVTKEIPKSQHADTDTAKVEPEDFLTSISKKPHEPPAISTIKDCPITTKEIEHIEATKETVTEDISKSEGAGIETAKVAINRLLTTISEEPTEDLVFSQRKGTKDIDVIKETVTKDILESQDSNIESTKVVLEDLLASVTKEPSEHLPIPAKKDSNDIKITKEIVTKDISELQDAYIRDAKHKSKAEYKSHYAADEWNYTKLSHQVEATKKGLDKLCHVVDLLAEKIKKLEAKRRKGAAPASLDLEDIDDRLSELEETMARFAADHKLLMEMNDRLQALLEEFEALRALAELLDKMQIDISKKADKEETMAALDLKADVELVNSKVDRFEFETAIEELGEAIGLLGLKFIRKNDEWEERAAQIWDAIDSKMTFDVFEAARIKFESRLTALMYGLRTMKKVVEELLYPESSGVTRCILCRRPACISGLECMETIKIIDSPERLLSVGSSGDAEDLQNSVSDKELTGMSQMKLQPASPDRSSEMMSKVKRTKTTKPYEFLDFTKVMLSKVKRDIPATDLKFIAIPAAEPPQKATSTISSKGHSISNQAVKYQSSVSKSSVDLTPDPANTIDVFVPAKSMPDVLRRDVLLSPTALKEDKPNITLSPSHFEK